MKKALYASILAFLFISASNFPIVELNYPTNWPKPYYNFELNPLDSNVILLGRVLFYDPILSADNTISCSSCHSPFNAFAHTDHDLSHGIYDVIGTRNAPALFNLAWQNSFMWDGAINHLDMQALAPISHPQEMGESINNVLKKVNILTRYKKLSNNAFGDSSLTGEHLLKAISQFQLTLVSANSKYDNVKSGFAEFNDQELNGYQLFQKNCNTCHTEPLFISNDFAHNGLDIDTTLNDFGRQKISMNKADSLKFKIPSLRNLSFTYPYMHDGRFGSLNAVLTHYATLKTNQEILDNRLKTITLSSRDKTDLIAFLLTLNDKEFVFSKAHSFPKEILLVGE
jgi:cytochrome c peroxidase